MKLYYEDKGQGPVILLLHGFTGSGADWLPVLTKLPGEHRYIIPDQRGHGRSPNPSEFYTHRQSAADVFELLDGLGIERFTACGMSGGSMALLHMATQQPERVERMVLISSTTHYPPQAREIMSRMDPDNQSEEAWSAMRARHPLGDDQIIKLWRQGRDFKDDVEDMAFQPQDLAKITANTLIVHGDRDPLFPVDIPVSMFHAIPGSSLWIIPGSGHIPVFGDFSEIFFSTVSRFLAVTR